MLSDPRIKHTTCALLVAVKNRRHEIARLIIRDGRAIIDSDRNIIMRTAIDKKDIEMVEILLDTGKINISQLILDAEQNYPGDPLQTIIIVSDIFKKQKELKEKDATNTMKKSEEIKSNNEAGCFTVSEKSKQNSTLGMLSMISGLWSSEDKTKKE